MAVDWAALERDKWRIVRELESDWDLGAAAFAREVVSRLKDKGWRLDEEAEARIDRQLADLEQGLRDAIETAIGIVAGKVVAEAMRPQFVAEQVRDAFERRWEDGVPLSKRLWKWRGEMLDGVRKTMSRGAALGRSANALVYGLQRAIEAEGGRYAIPANIGEDFFNPLVEEARRVIATPRARARWRRALDIARNHLARLKEGGTRRQAEVAVNAVARAVNEGRNDLLEAALRWWVYDRHLYNLRRVARTEIATAYHRATIGATRDDDLVIGYRWRLSASHPDPDICDWFAGIELGLGKGVWPKDRAPEGKAHPHCMCGLTPVTRPNREQGARDPGELLGVLSDREKARIAPRWARDLNGLGIDWKRMIDPATGWFARRKDIAARMGEDRLQAMQALGRALDVPEWGRPRIGRGRMRRETMDVLMQHRSDPVVAKALRQAERDGRVDGLVLHYVRRRYQDGEPLSGPEDLNRRFERLLQGSGHRIYRQALGGGTRFAIYSEETGWVAVVDASGRRVTAFIIDPDSNPGDLGEPLWLIGELKAF